MTYRRKIKNYQEKNGGDDRPSSAAGSPTIKCGLPPIARSSPASKSQPSAPPSITSATTHTHHTKPLISIVHKRFSPRNAATRSVQLDLFLFEVDSFLSVLVRFRP